MKRSKSLSAIVIAALNEVLLQAALRAERANANRTADDRARELAKWMDERAGAE